MGALVQDSCVLVLPYVRAKGRIVVSKGGGRFGRHGRLGLRFDSLEVRSGHWVAISGVLDTLEYAKPGALTDSGLVSSGKTSVGGVGRKLLPAGVAAAADLDAIPVAVDRKSTRLNSSHGYISYAVFCLKKKKKQQIID